MKQNIAFIMLLLLIIELSACITAGTHASIKAYKYPVKKSVLQNVIREVIAENPNIPSLDTTENPIINAITGKRDTILEQHYKAYQSIDIIDNGDTNRYTFHYTGSKEEWDTAMTSEISIAYAHNKNGNGGSEGNGDFPWYKQSLKNKLVEIFERELIKKIDKKLVVNRKETD